MRDVTVALGARLPLGARVRMLWMPQPGSRVVDGVLVECHLSALAVMDDSGKVTVPPRWCVVAAGSATAREMEGSWT